MQSQTLYVYCSVRKNQRTRRYRLMNDSCYVYSIVQYTALLEKTNVLHGFPLSCVPYVSFYLTDHYTKLFNNCSMNRSLNGTPSTLFFF